MLELTAASLYAPRPVRLDAVGGPGEDTRTPEAPEADTGRLTPVALLVGLVGAAVAFGFVSLSLEVG